MTYSHGVYIQENPTSLLAPIVADSGIQVVVGTAPVHLLEDHSEAVNKPVLAYSFAEASSKLGFNTKFDKWTICQAVDASFRVYNVAPIIMINVLDPAVHKDDITDESHSVSNKEVLVEVDGVMLDDDFVLKVDATTYTRDTDYTVAHNDDGYPVVTILDDGSIPGATESVLLSYTKIDPTAVDDDDIVGSYNSTTGTYKGLECVNRIYPELGLIPGLLLAPGYSHKPAVAAAMLAKTTTINGSFSCMAVLDIDTTSVDLYDKAKAWKDTNGYVDTHAICCWPKVKVGTKEYYYSAMVAALTAYTDGNNDNVPYCSPSNKSLRISGSVLADGTEVNLDQLQANHVNGGGIVTTLNINGWKCWGNNTSAYPDTSDVKDRWIPTRRMFNWWGNTFILTYFQKVDEPTNRRTIECIVDSENIRANGYKARDQIAGAKIEFNIDENPVTDIMAGIIRFKQYLTPFPPAETIINTLEFDPAALTEYLS